MRCSTCGAQNEEDAIRCVVCNERPYAESEDNGPRQAWLDAMPDWLRWFIALPGVAIAAAMIIRPLEHAGFDDATTGIVFPAAIAIVMFGAAQIAARTAPSYKKHVGLAIVFAELAAFCMTFLYIMIFHSQTSPYPTMVVSLNLIIPLLGAAAAVVLLGVGKTICDEPMKTLIPPGLNVGFRRGLGIALALATSAAVASIGLGASAVCRTCLSISAVHTLSAVIGTAIIVALVVAYEPVKKKVAAWVVAGIFIVASVVGIGIIAKLFVRYHDLFPLDPYFLSSVYYSLNLSAASIVGTILGLQAVNSGRADSQSTPQ
jgi:hypothetical protein